MTIGKIHRVPLREVWRHEARDFTVWLEENIEVLNDALDVAIVSADREQPAGDFNVDLVCENNAGDLVVIENQLERSNHDHLGKLITYLTALDAKVAIWIVSEPRPEHVKAISWLNESSSASFYLVKVEAIQIGDSEAAPLLTLITGPSIEAIRSGETKKEIASRYLIRRTFWAALLEESKRKTKLHSSISPGSHSWLGSGAGLPAGLSLNYAVRRHDSQVELYIDGHQGSEEHNRVIFAELFSKRAEVEASFGEQLVWEPLEGRRACRISKRIDIGGWQDEEEWPEVHRLLVESMVALESALRPHMKGLGTLNRA